MSTQSHEFTHNNNFIFSNPNTDVLLEHAIKYTGAKTTSEGALSVYTGKHTGRAAKDKYVVVTDKTESTIDWANNINKMSPDTFANIKTEVISHINNSEKLYVSEKNVGAHPQYSIKAQLYSTHPSHTLFFNYLMRDDKFGSDLGTYKIYHAPTLKIDTSKYDIRSETVIAMDMDKNEVLIAGTLYAGEIKKSLFSAMNYILPEKNIFPMHAGSNVDSTGNVSVFFGLSGTGKTTLSTQEGKLLIGDDEHALCEDGIFNFEGGCYAKTYKLSQSGEPGIYKAANTKGAILENVVLGNGEVPDFNDKSIAENGRCAYPLSFIDGVEPNSRGGHPKNMFFLTADAFGVLPPVSKLTKNQAMYYFLSGYTAKLAGTEVGVTEPQATFSTCFGAPFMMRKASEYADLLGHYIDKHGIKVWLVNTGWTGGAYGEGERFPLKVTRRIIDSIQEAELDKADFEKENYFGLEIPTSINGVESTMLNPKKSWSDENAYDAQAKKLAKMFVENFSKFKANSNVVAGGPAL